MKLHYLKFAMPMMVLAILVSGASASVIGQPGAPTTCCGVYDAGTTAFVLPGPDLTAFSSLTSGAETLTSLNSLLRFTVPTTWASWSSPPDVETATPNVAWDSVSTNTFTLNLPVEIFGFELEPSDLGTFNYTVSFFNNTTSLGSISLPVNGSSGARFFALEVTGNQINTVTITGADPGGYAVANIRFARAADSSVPEPGSSLLMLWGVAMIVALLRFAPRKA